MQEIEVQTEEYQELVDRFNHSVRRKNRAKRAVGASVLAVSLLFLMAIYLTFKTFVDLRLPELAKVISEQMGRDSELYARGLLATGGRLYQPYTKAFQLQFARDWPKMEAVSQSELQKLHKFTRKRWPVYEAQLRGIASDQQQLLREELEISIGKKEAVQIMKAYEQAIAGTFDQVMRTALREHLEVGRELQANLIGLIDTEPDVSRPIDRGVALGVFLEAIGLEMQAVDSKY